jgi:hypothetical protein
MMFEPIHYKGQITFRDTIRAEAILTRKKVWSFSGVVIILLLIVTSLIFINKIEPWYYTAGFFVITGALFGGVFWLTNLLNKKRRARAYEKDKIERYGVIAEDSMEFNTALLKNIGKWELFKRVELAENLAIIASDVGYIAFAPYMFDSPADWERCWAFFLGKQKELAENTGKNLGAS